MPPITADKPEYCEGDNARFSINTPLSSAYIITWYNNSQPVAGSINKTGIVSNVPGDYTVDITSTSPNTDGSYCGQTSGTRGLSFSPPPTLNIEQAVLTTLCEGQQVELRANYSSGTLRWSTGETSTTIRVSRPGNYSVKLSNGGCEVEANTNVSFLPLPVFT